MDCYNTKCVHNVEYSYHIPQCGIQEPIITLYEPRDRWSNRGIYECRSCKY